MPDETVRLTEQEESDLSLLFEEDRFGALLAYVRDILTARLAEQKAERAAAILALADEWADTDGMDPGIARVLRALVGESGAAALDRVRAEAYRAGWNDRHAEVDYGTSLDRADRLSGGDS